MPCYADIKALVQQGTNPLGSAIALICQLNENKIMKAKTSFTERFLRFATDLFDEHLREVGALDLEACSKFVEEKTGFRMTFETKSGASTWRLVEGRNVKGKARPAVPLADPSFDFFCDHFRCSNF